MVFLFDLVLLLTVFSISQQQMCPPDNEQAMTICTDDSMGWRSNISTARGSSNGGRSYEIMWDNDMNYSTSPGGYVLVYSELGSGTTQTLMPTNMNQGFTIMDLKPGTHYDTMVCLPQSLPTTNFELSPGCGNCRLCFRTSTATAAPIIVEATVQEIPMNMGMIYICEAVGGPLPNITWSAINLNGNQQQLLNTTDVTIVTEIMNKVVSQLTLSINADLIDPVCTAGNGIGTVSENMFMMVSPPSSQQSISLGTIIAIVVSTITIAVVPPLIGVVFCLCCIRIYKRKICSDSHDYVSSCSMVMPAKVQLMDDPFIAIEPYEHATLNNSTGDKGKVNIAETYFLTRQQSLLQNLPKSLIISPSKIQVSTVIGQGEFGIIYKGYLKSDMMDTVAIKTLKGIFATASDIESVSNEIEKMQHFKHPNVMSLIGVCMAPSEQDANTGGPCIVMPFMAKGNLLDKLRKESDELIMSSEDDKNQKERKQSFIPNVD